MPADSLTMVSSMATRALLTELIAEFTRKTSHGVQLESAGGVDVARRVQGGEAVDVVVLAFGRRAVLGRRMQYPLLV